MQIDRLHLTQFRNYQDDSFEFNNGLTIIEGPNGTGKTNLLEGVYTLATTRSFRARDKELITYNQDWYRLEGGFTKLMVELNYRQSVGDKNLIVNKKTQSLQNYTGRVPVVLFEPMSLAIITSGPQERRRFLNRVLAASDPRYLRNILLYRRILKHRNALLRSHSTNLKEEIFAWDIKLVELATAIVTARQQLAAYFNEGLSKLYSQIAGHRHQVNMIYHLQVTNRDYSSGLLEMLQSRLGFDATTGFTSVGPHRDDIRLLFDERAAASNASRGEVRTLILALKLLELHYLEKTSGQKPILLFDDVFSELDESRRCFLLEQLKGYQTIITTTDTKGLRNSLPKQHAIIKLKKRELNAR